jgi:hypothetical protein
MDTITLGPKPIARYVLMTVGTSIATFTDAQLMGRNGQQVVRAVGRVLAQSVNMGIKDIINPTAGASGIGLVLAANDVIVLEGHENISRSQFIQNSGAATIVWFLHVDLL